MIRSSSLMVQALKLSPQDQNQTEPASLNGKETERQIVLEKDVPHTVGTVETAKEQKPSPTSPKCTFSKTVIPVDLNRFTASSVTVVECPGCGRTRSLTPVKGVLRFPPHEPRKIQTELRGRRWSTTGKTDWDVVGG